MTASVVSNSCRLTIISSNRRVDLAVPVTIAVAELLAIIVSSLGREVADQGVAEGGWVLQRAAEQPLDPAVSVGTNHVRDGDVLHLRTRANRLPEVAFDDVLDAVATGVRTRTSRWQPVHTLRGTTGFAAAALLFALITLVLIGPSWTAIAITAGAAALLLVVTATALGRSHATPGPAVVAGGFAVAFASVSGAGAVGRAHEFWRFGAPQVLVGGCAAALVATMLLLVSGRGFAGWVTVLVVSALTAIGTGIATSTSLSGPATAAVIATVALAVSPALPRLSITLSRLPLPAIPHHATDLHNDIGTVDSRQILSQAVRADQFLTGLVGGVALAIAGSAVLISGRGTSEYVLAVVLALICLLRARLFTGSGQRGLLLLAGGIALAAMAVAGVLNTHGTVRLLAFAIPAVAIAVILFALTVTLPGHRYAPPWSRTADIIETVLVLSVIPLALAVMGVYGAVRTLNQS